MGGKCVDNGLEAHTEVAVPASALSLSWVRCPYYLLLLSD